MRVINPRRQIDSQYQTKTSHVSSNPTKPELPAPQQPTHPRVSTRHTTCSVSESLFLRSLCPYVAWTTHNSHAVGVEINLKPVLVRPLRG